MVFRVAVSADITQMQIVRNLVQENALSNPLLVTDADYEDYINRRGKGWVCETGKMIAGFAIVSLTDNNVWALFVKPGYDKQGIGRQLHDRMIDWYFEQTNAPIWLSTAPGTRAEGFYHKAGWTPTGISPTGEIVFEMTEKKWKQRTDF